MKTIRWGIIGCGDVTEVKSGPAFAKCRNSTLVAVMRRNKALARDYAARHQVPRWHDDARAIFEASDIDAVYIATRPDAHHDYALAAAAAGKAVYVEKPMAMSHAECLAMIEAAKRAGMPLFVAYYRRAMPYFAKVKALLDDGAIGRPTAVLVRHAQPLPDMPAGETPWRVDPAFGRGGIFFETLCHSFDILDFLLGPITAQTGYPANLAGAYAPEDTVAAAFSFAAGPVGSALCCFAADRTEDLIEIEGTAGRLRCHPFSFQPISLTRGGTEESFAIQSPEHVQQPLIQSIVDQLNGVGKCPSDGESAARTARVIEEILAPYYRTGG